MKSGAEFKYSLFEYPPFPHCLTMMNISLEQVIQPVPFTLPPPTPMGEAIARMSQHGVSYVLVVDDHQHLQGIVTERDVVRLIAADADMQEQAIAAVMTQNIITHHPSEQVDIFALFQRMQQHRIRHLPVLGNQGELAGIITLSSLRQALKPEYLLRFRRVVEVMTRSVVGASQLASLSHLAELMSRHRVSCVVIIDAPDLHSCTPSSAPVPSDVSGHHPIGIVTERDILQFQSLGLDFSRVTAGEVMSAPVGTIGCEESLWVAHETMQHMRVRRLVVTDDQGLLAGIVTQSDVLRILDPVELCSIISALERSLIERTAELEQEKHQRHLVEQARQITEERLALTLELSGTGSWDLDLATGQAIWNDNHFRLMGLEPGEAEPNYATWARHVHPDDLGKTVDAFTQTIETDGELAVEYRVVHPDTVDSHQSTGRSVERWVQIRGRAVRDSAGRAIRLVGISLDITARKRMEDALMRSESHNRAVLNAVPDLLAIFGRDGRFQEVIRQSNSLENLTDYLPLDINPVGRHVSEILPAHVATRHLQGIQTAIATGNIQNYEQEVRIGDRIQYEDVRVSPIDDESVLVMVRDISDRKRSELEWIRAETARQESESRFQEIANAIDQKFFIRCAETGKFLYVSPAYETLYGRSRQSLYDDPDSWMEAIHPNDQNRIRQSVRDQFSHDALTREFRIIHTNGAIRWIHTHTKVIRDASGQPTKLIGLASDITEQKQYEACLRQYERIVNATTDGVVLFDENYRYKIVNQTYLDWHQRRAEDMIGQPVSDILGHDFFQTVMKGQLDRCLQGELIHFETWSRPLLSPRRYFDVRYTPYREVDGTITGVVTVLRDLTELKQALDARQASEARNRAFLDALPDLLVCVDRHANVKDIVFPKGDNANLYIRPQQNLGEIVGEANLQIDLEAIHQALDTGTVQIRELQVEKYGALAYEEIRVARLDDDDALMIVRDITDRKHIEAERERAKQEVHVQRDFLQRVVNAIPSAIFVKDPDGHYLLLNQATADLYGSSMAVMLGRRDYDFNLNHPQVDMFLAQNRQVIETQQPQLFADQLIPHVSQSSRWYQTMVSPLLDKQGVVQGVIGNCIDITDRKCLELDLKRSQAKLNDILASVGASIGYFNFYPDGTWETLYHSQGSEQIFGYAPDDFPAEVWLANIVAEDVNAILSPALAAIRQGKSCTIEYRFRRPDGLLGWISDTLTSRWDDEQQCWIVTAVGIDVSDRKRIEIEHHVIEDALRRENQFRSQIIEQMAEGLCVCCEVAGFPYLYFSLWNQRMTDITGYTQEEMNEKGWYQSLYPDPEVRARVVERLTRMRQGDHLKHEEWVITRSDGQQRTVSISTMLLSVGSGVPLVLAVMEDVSNYKEIESALRQSRAELQLITDSIPAGIAYIDPDQRYRFVNKTYEQWFNRRSQDIIGMTVHDLLGDVSYEICKPSIEQVLGGTRFVGERCLQFHDGQSHDILVDLLPDIDPDGTVKGYYALVTDIGDRKQAEAAIENQRKLLRQVIDAIPNLIFARDRDGRFLMANEAAAALHGITPNHLIGNLEQTFNPYIDDDWTRQMLATNRQVMDSGKPTLISEELLTTAGGDRRWYQTSIISYIDAHGNILGIIGTSIDITERKHAEIALMEQRNFLQQVIDAIPNSVFVKNPDGQYLLANKAVGSIHGQAAEALVGKRDIDFYDDEDQAAQFLANNCRVMETLQSQTNPDEYIVNYEGEGRWYQTTISPFLDMDGTVRGVIGTSVDISDRKQIEQNLQQSLREKEVLLSEVHHRVKNNLQVIVSLLNLQAMRIDDSDVQQVLERSGDRVHAMALVHEKLYRTQYFEGISLSEYIHEFVDHLVQGHTTLNDRVAIHYRLDNSINLPLAQAIQVSLILNELATNALKHGTVLQDGHQHLYIDLDMDLAPDEDTHVVLRVGNTGHPLPADFSLNAPRLSMGLQLIQVLAEQINGTIQIHSSPLSSEETNSREPLTITWFTLRIPQETTNLI